MKKKLPNPLMVLFGMAFASLLWAQEPALVRTLPSGSKLVIDPDPQADFVSIEVLIDKRPFRNDILKQVYVRAFLLCVRQELFDFPGTVSLSPIVPVPESVYDPRDEQYLRFKIASSLFEKNMEAILKGILGKMEHKHFPQNAREGFFVGKHLANLPIPMDSLKHIVANIKFNVFKEFVNSSSLRSQMLVHVEGNVNVFHLVNTAIRLSPVLSAQVEVSKHSDGKQVADWYWTYVFWRFSEETIKTIAGRCESPLPLRLYMPLSDDGRAIEVRLMRGPISAALPDSLAKILQQRFIHDFYHWYREQYFYEMQWIFDGSEQKGFFKLLSLARCGQADALFMIREKVDNQALKFRFNLFLKRLHLSKAVSK